MSSWEDLVADPQYVANAVRPQMQDIVERAVAAGAKPPLEYIGAGMTSVVFCVDVVAYKTARSERTMSLGTLHDEAEWLETAKTVPWVIDFVANFRRFDSKNVVIVRACPTPGPDMTPYRYGESKLWDLHQEIGKRMIPHGWSAPEFKPDSYVITKDGPMLVDASFAHRVGQRLLDYARDLISGRREPGIRENPENTAFDIRVEIGHTLTAEDAEEVLAELRRLESSGNKWTAPGETTMKEKSTHDRPLAARGLKSYRYRGEYGWVIIGARDNADALREAERSIDGKASLDRLQIWSGTEYVNVVRGPAMAEDSSWHKKNAIELQRIQRSQSRAEIAAARQEAADARTACSVARKVAIETCAGAKTSRIKRDALVALAHEYRLIRRAELARLRGKKQHPGVSRAEKRGESDDAVLHNIPPELVPTWEHVKRGIQGNPRMSRTEAFLEWVEKHPSEIVFIEPSDEDYAASWEKHHRRVGETSGSDGNRFIDYLIFDADDQDVGLFSRATTDEIARHFKIDPKDAFRELDALAEKGLLTKSRDIVKKHRGKTAVGYQVWEYDWRPGDLERYDRGR